VSAGLYWADVVEPMVVLDGIAPVGSFTVPSVIVRSSTRALCVCGPSSQAAAHEDAALIVRALIAHAGAHR
jgi:hypothetical protein